ncbi:MAG: hypothetical protein HKN82_01440 [Akkermansiaceae bacterium]|nr:hypothetical protein [Akkermansiaceae bacterium]NNM28332.1 hypothetical protein [Akkermansiaceae bacterium]
MSNRLLSPIPFDDSVTVRNILRESRSPVWLRLALMALRRTMGLRCVAGVVVLLLFCHTSSAGVIVGINSATTDMGFLDSNWVLEHSINQSGLSGYDPGVTDFDGCVTTAVHSTGRHRAWMNSNSVTSGPQASHVRLEILSVRPGGRNFAGNGELAFEQVTAIPEPGPPALLGMAMVVMARRRR